MGFEPYVSKSSQLSVGQTRVDCFEKAGNGFSRQMAVNIGFSNETYATEPGLWFIVFFIRGEGLIPRPFGRETNCSPLSMLGIKPETNTSGERNTPLLAAGDFIVRRNE